MPWSSRNPSTMIRNGIESSPVNMPYLPDDVLLNCLARESRLYYPTLSLVSKRFRSLLASTELYKTRTLLGITESCLYVCFPYPRSSRTLWFTLSRKPTRISNPWSTPGCNPFRILTRKESSGNLLVSVPALNSGSRDSWIPTMVGSDLYVMIGGFTNYEPSSRVFVMDCRCHTWHEAPRMLVAKKSPLVSVLDGKLYIVEGSTSCDLSNIIECFDPKTQIWEHVPSPSAEIRGTKISSSLVFEGNLYLFCGDKNYYVVYKPKENKWDVVGRKYEHLLWLTRISCVIDNVFYKWFPTSKTLQWYDSDRGIWKDLKGLGELPKFPNGSWHGRVKLTNSGGKLLVLWDKNVRFVGSTKTKKIWCAEIAIEKPNKQEIRAWEGYVVYMTLC